MGWFARAFERFSAWLVRVFDWLIRLSARPRIQLNLGPGDPVDCRVAEGTAIQFSYDIDPAGATIQTVEIYRVYSLDGPSQLGSPIIEGREYKELIFRDTADSEPIRLTRGPINDRGLAPGGHWGHSAFYDQYRLVVTTTGGTVVAVNKPVRFASQPQYLDGSRESYATSSVVVPSRPPSPPEEHDVRPAYMRLVLDNVTEVTVDNIVTGLATTNNACSLSYEDRDRGFDPETGRETHQILATARYNVDIIDVTTQRAQFWLSHVPAPPCPSGTDGPTPTIEYNYAQEIV